MLDLRLPTASKNMKTNIFKLNTLSILQLNQRLLKTFAVQKPPSKNIQTTISVKSNLHALSQGLHTA